ncbi:carbon-nitrogen hydrolase family protein [Litorivivens sp.]|uniref:carbon-nitrogen hydrolase family protein n=1 Tax=Litorivivens sp. TaxID=2020868 RepID=UPI003565B7B4
MKLAAIQMVSGANIDNNLSVAERLIAQARADDARLVVLPESFALFGDSTQLKPLAARERSQGYLQSWLAAQARSQQVILVGGTVPVASDDGRAWATCFVHGEDGALLGRYQKMHLFDAAVGDAQGRYCESRDYRPGLAPCVVDTSLGRLGVAVCYDLRFAAQFQWMQEQGAELLAVPSAFTRKTGLAHWSLLLRARAVETQCVAVGANQGGLHSRQRMTSGCSAVVDGWGKVLAEAGYGEAVVMADWNVTHQREWRRSMPVADHARFTVAPPTDQ